MARLDPAIFRVTILMPIARSSRAMNRKRAFVPARFRATSAI
jgi:hypothetical protein